MPLRQGKNPKDVSANIRQLIHDGMARNQAVAIALKKARELARAKMLDESRGGEKGVRWRVVLLETKGAGPNPTYDVIWRKGGASRAHRHEETRDLREARRWFAAFVREARRSSPGGVTSGKFSVPVKAKKKPAKKTAPKAKTKKKSTAKKPAKKRSRR